MILLLSGAFDSEDCVAALGAPGALSWTQTPSLDARDLAAGFSNAMPDR